MMGTPTNHAYVVECSCGHDFRAEAPDREAAVQQMKKVMDRSAVERHFKKYHAGEPIADVDELHAHIETDIEEK